MVLWIFRSECKSVQNLENSLTTNMRVRLAFKFKKPEKPTSLRKTEIRYRNLIIRFNYLLYHLSRNIAELFVVSLPQLKISTRRTK